MYHRDMTSTADQAATSMARYIATSGRSLLQIEVADHLQATYGSAAVYTDPMSGNRRIHRTVLAKLRRRYPEVAYNRHIEAWECPENFDVPDDPPTLW